MEKINWGIIGCGDVAEMKSGPAFQRVRDSSLVAVMRRNGEKAKDFAQRHNVPKWYDDGIRLINDPDVNAVYIATPPSSHEYYTLEALKAGKRVYLEKPMTLDFAGAQRIVKAAVEMNAKLTVAHYRREQPFFKKIKELLDDRVIGKVRTVQLSYFRKSLTAAELQIPGNAWRVTPSVSGGGLFHDLAPHQIDIIYYFFGPVKKACGIATNQAQAYRADDVVAGNILFSSGVLFSGLWCFNVGMDSEKDLCEITGTDGKISFSVFPPQKITVNRNGKVEIITFSPLMHVQEPMIEKVVDFFLDRGPNPCSAEDGSEVMYLMDTFTR
jgi:predicted dehydrogenase